MQSIRILQSWNCVLEDCKVAKIKDIAMLRCWEKAGKRRYQGGEKPPRPLGRKGLRSASVGAEQTSPGRLAPPEGAKALLIERSLSKVLLRYFRGVFLANFFRFKRLAVRNKEICHAAGVFRVRWATT